MGLFRNEIQIAEKHKTNKPDKVRIKCLNVYNAMREGLDENNTLTVKHQPIEFVKPKKQK